MYPPCAYGHAPLIIKALRLLEEFSRYCLKTENTPIFFLRIKFHQSETTNQNLTKIERELATLYLYGHEKFIKSFVTLLKAFLRYCPKTEKHPTFFFMDKVP